MITNAAKKTKNIGLDTTGWERWIHSGLCKKLMFYRTKKVQYAQSRIRSREWDARSSLRFWDTSRSHNFGQSTRPCNSQQKWKKKDKKENLPNSGLSRPGGPQSDNKRMRKERPCPRTKKMVWNMKVTVIPIVICAFRTIFKSWVKWLEDLKISGRVESIQTGALLRSARILRRVLKTWGDLMSLRLEWKTISQH